VRRRDFLLGLPALAGACAATSRAPAARGSRGRWTEADAAAWRRRRGWLVGCNFIPSTASNQLEMWQAATFDPATIDRELGFAAGLGWNSARVFLHDLAWSTDPQGFFGRVDRVLALAARRGIGALLVLLDGVWDPQPHAGAQPPPVPGVHNSRWVQSPGAAVLGDPARHGEIERYVRAVVRHFRDDDRVHGWDLFNEADNPNAESYGATELPDKEARAVEIAAKAFRWAREERPAQPLTVGAWRGDWGDVRAFRPLDRLAFEESDVLSFHCYASSEGMRERIAALRRYGRPLLCTEFMARAAGSTFDPVLGLLRDEEVGAYAWGLVAGKTQTIHGWESWKRPDAGEPARWFHDLLRPDGSPFDAAEVAYVRGVTRARP
jgi:hypothetical protein